jgi:hypothetical protein
MKGNRQRRREILARRKQLAIKRAGTGDKVSGAGTSRFIPVNSSVLAPNNSYGVPDFVQRGYYVDRPFRCIDCGKEEIWTGSQQKWWYEVAKGFVYSTAVRCRSCRRRERARRTDARRVHLAGAGAKATRSAKSTVED